MCYVSHFSTDYVFSRFVQDDFCYDVFLSYSAKDKAVVRPLAERLRTDGVKIWFDEWVLKPGDSVPSKIEEGLEHSRVLVLCISANAFGSDWAQLESGTFRFRDPLNKERRLLPLRLDEAPIKETLAQHLYINWLPASREHKYAELLAACRPPAKPTTVRSRFDVRQCGALKVSPDGEWVLFGDSDNLVKLFDSQAHQRRSFLGHPGQVRSVSWARDSRQAVSGDSFGSIIFWDVKSGENSRIQSAHSSDVWSVALSRDQLYAVSGSADKTIQVWNVKTSDNLWNLQGHTSDVWSVAFSEDQRWVASGSGDRTVRVWNLKTGVCERVFSGHTSDVWSVAFSNDQRFVISGSGDRSVRVWDIERGACIMKLQGHTGDVWSVAMIAESRRIVSGSGDRTIRVWDFNSGNCIGVLEAHLTDVQSVVFNTEKSRIFSGARYEKILSWDLDRVFTAKLDDAVSYTNAKVLVVGDTHSGKTGLTHRLATGEWTPSNDSTVGAWSTQWRLRDASGEVGLDKEIWLWDFGGQADQRLIHQLYMDRTALILLLFNADEEDILPGLRDWQTMLRRSVQDQIPHFLVAGRIDTGFRASRGKLQAFVKEQGLVYYETSAKSGEGCDELRAAMITSIPWTQMERRASPRIFKLIKDEILALRDEGQVLHTFKELRELLWRRLSDEPRFTDETLQTVIGLLDGPGVVKELDYGTYILLAPEWVNAYAQAVIRTLRGTTNDLGVLPLRSIAEGKLIYQSIGRDGVPTEVKRLPPAEERVVLGEMERQLEQRGLCLRQGDKLVFPSHCGRDRPAVSEHPSVFVSYAIRGFLDDIYATLVVKLADSESFKLRELWRDAADFVTLAGDYHMGIKLTRDSGSAGDISVYFGKGVTQEEQVIFANYIDAHLERSCEKAERLRHYVCPKCQTSKGNLQVLMKKLLRDREKADTECDGCGERFLLWDALEKKFASSEVMRQVIELQVEDAMRLDSRRKGKLLALEVGSRITSADQKCFEIPATEDEGIDMELEFTNDEGKGTGKRLYLQLKSGNSYLETRKDGREIFSIRDQRWVEYWLAQREPVMLVIGTFHEEDERSVGKEKLEFGDVRWMEISSVLRRETQNGTRPVKQIEFKGERLDLSSVRRWREKIMASTPL